MTQFHEGQDVEVKVRASVHDDYGEWRKAKIVRRAEGSEKRFLDWWEVQFPELNGKYDVDGERAVFDADHIRTQS